MTREGSYGEERSRGQASSETRRRRSGAIAAIWERFGLALILFAGVVLRIALDRGYEAALVMRDEAGYLANAAALAGHAFDGANSYHAGYSLLILPAFVLFDDPLSVYRCVQAINILLAALAVLIVHGLLRDLFPEERRARLLLALAVAAAYPAWFVLSPLAMSENGMVPAFCLAAWCCMQVARKGGVHWIVWGVVCGFLYFVHPTALATLAAALLVGIVLAGARGEWKWLAAFVASIASMLFLYAAVIEPWLITRLSVQGYPPLLHYPGMASALQPLMSMAGLLGLARRVGGHAFYVIVGSVWLAWFAAAFAADRIRVDARARRIGPETAVIAFVVLAVLGVLALSGLTFAALHGDRLDHWMYGRYVEGVLMPALAIGAVVACRVGRALMPGMLVAAAGAALVSGINTPINTLNVSALWEMALAPSGPAAIWWLLGAIAAGVIWLVPWNAIRVGILVATFAGATILAYTRFLQPCHDIYAERYMLANFVRQHVSPVPTCVGIDARRREAPEDFEVAWAKYGAHLFDHGLRRITPEEWLASCDGPLISWSRDLDRRYPGVHLVAAERHDLQSTHAGPFLWLRGTSASSAPLRNGESVAFTNSNPRVPLMIGAGWHAPERDGTWSSASAELWIDVAPNCSRSTPCEATLSSIAFAASATRPLDVEVTIEGQKVAHWTISGTEPQTHALALYHDETLPSGVRVRFDIQGATSPQQRGVSSDPRVLGLKLREIALH